VLVLVLVIVIDKTYEPSNSLLLFSIDFSCRSIAAFLDVFDYDYDYEHEHEHEHEQEQEQEQEEPGYPLIPVRTIPFTKYCWAEKKMISTGTTEIRLAAMT